MKPRRVQNGSFSCQPDSSFTKTFHGFVATEEFTELQRLARRDRCSGRRSDSQPPHRPQT